MKFNFNPKSGLIFVPVTIKGPKLLVTANFILDTGATYTLVNTDILFKLGYSKGDYNKKISMTTATKKEDSFLIEINSISSMGHIIRNFDVVAKNLPPSLPVDGLLGLDFCRNKELCIDFRKGIISFN